MNGLIDKIFKDRETRERVKDNVEVALAVACLVGFVYKKISDKRKPEEITE